MRYFAKEREVVIVANNKLGQRFGQLIRERCVATMPAIDCSVHLGLFNEADIEDAFIRSLQSKRRG